MVKRELILFYHLIGTQILRSQKMYGWAAKIIDQLSKDLKRAFPEMKVFVFAISHICVNLLKSTYSKALINRPKEYMIVGPYGALQSSLFNNSKFEKMWGFVARQGKRNEEFLIRSALLSG